MVRRTKEEALATRDSILDAAEQLFVRQGVSHTTLQHIATEAGVTRGAIYWHFEDKAAVFNALMQRARMPLESAMQVLDQLESEDPLGDLRDYSLAVFRMTVENPRARTVFEIATLKMEYVDELSAVRARRKQTMQEWATRAERRVALAVKQGQIRAGVDAQAVALGLWSLTEGLIRNWLMTPSFDLLAIGTQAVDTHLGGLRA
ncbi:MAG: TetR family transcriptional regulator [Gammaproteobacteria bacterium]